MFYRGKWLNKNGRLHQPWRLANGFNVTVNKDIQRGCVESVPEVQLSEKSNLHLDHVCKDLLTVVKSKSNNLKHRISLRLSGSLLYGICRLYEMKINNFYDECYEKCVQTVNEFSDENMLSDEHSYSDENQSTSTQMAIFRGDPMVVDQSSVYGQVLDDHFSETPNGDTSLQHNPSHSMLSKDIIYANNSTSTTDNNSVDNFFEIIEMNRRANGSQGQRKYYYNFKEPCMVRKKKKRGKKKKKAEKSRRTGSSASLSISNHFRDSIDLNLNQTLNSIAHKDNLSNNADIHNQSNDFRRDLTVSVIQELSSNSSNSFDSNHHPISQNQSEKSYTRLEKDDRSIASYSNENSYSGKRNFSPNSSPEMCRNYSFSKLNHTIYSDQSVANIETSTPKIDMDTSKINTGISRSNSPSEFGNINHSFHSPSQFVTMRRKSHMCSWSNLNLSDFQENSESEYKHVTIKICYNDDLPNIEELVFITKKNELCQENPILIGDSDPNESSFNTYNLLQRLCAMWLKKDVIYFEEILADALELYDRRITTSRIFKSLLTLQKHLYINIEKDEYNNIKLIKKGSAFTNV